MPAMQTHSASLSVRKGPNQGRRLPWWNKMLAQTGEKEEGSALILGCSSVFPPSSPWWECSGEVTSTSNSSWLSDGALGLQYLVCTHPALPALRCGDREYPGTLWKHQEYLREQVCDLLLVFSKEIDMWDIEEEANEHGVKRGVRKRKNVLQLVLFSFFSCVWGSYSIVLGGSMLGSLCVGVELGSVTWKTSALNSVLSP